MKAQAKTRRARALPFFFFLGKFFLDKEVVLQVVVQSEVVHGCAKSGLESILKLNRSQAEASLV